MLTNVDTERRTARILSKDSGDSVLGYQLNAVFKIQQFPYFTMTNSDTDEFNETGAFGPSPLVLV